jgi:hypothetical protein
VIWLAAMLLAISPGKKVVSQEAIARALEAVHRGGGADAASKLASLTDGMDPADITYAAVDDLTICSTRPDDGVHYWIARTLGNLGGRVDHAIPRMIAWLAVADCLRGSKTSASGIRFALKRLGKPAPPPAFCKSPGEPYPVLALKYFPIIQDKPNYPVVISESKAAAEWFYANVLSGGFYASLGSHEADPYVMAKLVAKAEAYRDRTPDKKDAVFEVTILGRRPFWLGPAEARTMVGELMLLVDKQLSSDLARFQSTIWSLR